jgi:hypothetical protein
VARFAESARDLGQHSIGPGPLGDVADKALLSFANHAGTALSSTLGFVKSKDHSFPTGSDYDADMPLLAGLDFLVRVLLDIEVETIKRGECRTPNHVGSRSKKSLLGTFRATGLVVHVFAAGEGSRFTGLGIVCAGWIG